MTALRRIYELFPPRARERIKMMLGAHGHGQSRLDGLKAHDHALGKKRLDRVAQSFTPVLRDAGVTSLRGLSCLEFGAGYVPSEVLIFHLLGASRAVATDYNAIARLEHLATAARAADKDALLSSLAPFAAGVDLEQRLDALRGPQAQRHIAEHVLYLAPHDMSLAPLVPAFDFIHSVSVFEHLPPPLADGILGNLVETLAPSGTMITEIDLCDHRDPARHPLAFFAADDDYDPAADFDRRGNRLRRSQWLEMFGRHTMLDTRQIFAESLDPAYLPARCVALPGETDDVLVGALGLSSRRIPAP